jgi:hypothetical protein
VFLLIGDAGRMLIWNDSSLWENIFLPTQLGLLLNKFIAFFFIITAFGLGNCLSKNTIYLPQYLLKSLFYAFLIQCLRNLALFRYILSDVNLLFEHTIQISSPIFLYLLIQKPTEETRWLQLIRWAIFFTFLGHGLYALGIPYQPPHFLDMVIKIWQIDNWHASNFLKIAGFFDMIVCISILGAKKNQNFITYSLVYATLWGLMTALARPIANIYITEISLLSFQWFFEFLVRLPHVLLPYLVLASIYPNHNLFQYFSKDKLF